MKPSLKDQRDKLKPRYHRAKKSHKAREEIFARMQALVLKDLRRSIRDERKAKAA